MEGFGSRVFGVRSGRITVDRVSDSPHGAGVGVRRECSDARVVPDPGGEIGTKERCCGRDWSYALVNRGVCSGKYGQNNASNFNEIGVDSQSIHSVQQEPGVQRRRLRQTRHAIRNNGTTGIIDAWGENQSRGTRSGTIKPRVKARGESTPARPAERSRHGD